MSASSNALASVTDHYIGEWNALSPETQTAYTDFENFVSLKVKDSLGFNHPELVKAIVDIATNNARAAFYEEVFEAAENLFEALF